MGRQVQVAALARKHLRARVRDRRRLARDVFVYAAVALAVGLLSQGAASHTQAAAIPYAKQLGHQYDADNPLCFAPCGDTGFAHDVSEAVAVVTGEAVSATCADNCTTLPAVRFTRVDESVVAYEMDVGHQSSYDVFRWLADGLLWTPDYIQGSSTADTKWSGALGHQWLVDASVARVWKGVDLPAITVQLFPYGASTDVDLSGPSATFLLVLVVMLSALPVQATIYGVRTEAQLQLRAGLESWGVSGGVYLVSWWLTTLLEVLAALALAWTAVFGGGAITPGGAALLLEALLPLALSSATYATVCATLVRTPAVGSWTAALLWVVASVGAFAIGETTAPGWCYVCALLPPSAFALAARILFDGYASLSMSVQGDVGKTTFPVAFAAPVWVAVLVAAVLSALALWRWLAPQRLASASASVETEVVDVEEPLLSSRELPRYVEELAAGKVGLEAERLCKAYGETRAVEDLSVRLLTGEITCLLGANGAGKSTTIGLLSGRLEPTSGRVLCEGDVGVCPQSDIQWEFLTPAEHLELATAAKGAASSSSAGLLQRVGLEGREHVVVRELAPNERRLLSVAMALVGNPPVLLLDEPTAGLGLEARRRIWAVLEDLKRDRVILLATQLLDEAELLADRLCVLNAGHVYLHGTLGFAREQFRPQYLVNVPTTDASVADVVRAKAPAAELGKMTPSFTQFEVPLEARNELPALLRELEERGWQPQMAVSSLEDAFVTMMHELAAYEHEMVERTPSAVETSTATTTTTDTFWGQVTALVARRTGPGWRSWTSLSGFRGQCFAVAVMAVIGACVYGVSATDVLDRDASQQRTWHASTLEGAELLAGQPVLSAGDLSLPSLSQWAGTPSDELVAFPGLDPLRSAIQDGAIPQPAAGAVWWDTRTDTTTLLYNGTSLMAPPALLGLVHSTVVANLSGGDYGSEPLLQASIVGTTAPATIAQSEQNAVLYSTAGAAVLLVALIFCEAAATATHERVSGFKHGVYIAGASQRAYWLSSLLLDGRFAAVLVGSWLLAIVVALGAGVLVSSQFALRTTASVVFAPLAAIIELYVLSFAFASSNAARSALLLFAVSIAAAAIVFRGSVVGGSVDIFGEDECDLAYTFTFVGPLLSLAYSASAGLPLVCDYYGTNSQNVLAYLPIASAAAYALLLAILERGTRPRAAGNNDGVVGGLDVEGVSVADRLSDVALRVASGSCTGLLAPSGGGKSLLLRVLAGAVSVTSGTVSAPSSLGYCPQTDPVLERTTASEHLLLMARLRRVDAPETAVDALVAQLGLQKHRDMPTMALSGGTRRKVALGMALVGWPRAVVLDDPTRGLDPTARRQAWSLIAAAVARGCAVVVASNSTVEVQALCDHALVLSKDGRVAAQGSLLELQEEHTSGLLASFMVEDEEGGMDPVRAFVRQLCPDAVFVDWHRSQLRCKLPGNDMHVADVLEALEGAREELRLVDFTVWQPTLEHVYESVLGL